MVGGLLGVAASKAVVAIAAIIAIVAIIAIIVIIAIEAIIAIIAIIAIGQPGARAGTLGPARPFWRSERIAGGQLRRGGTTMDLQATLRASRGLRACEEGEGCLWEFLLSEFPPGKRNRFEQIRCACPK